MSYENQLPPFSQLILQICQFSYKPVNSTYQSPTNFQVALKVINKRIKSCSDYGNFERDEKNKDLLFYNVNLLKKKEETNSKFSND